MNSVVLELVSDRETCNCLYAHYVNVC